MRDTIFNQDTNQYKPFQFDRDVANAFDDMAKRSIPAYKECQSFILSQIKLYPKKQIRIFDLGCSTGELISYLIQHDKEKRFHYTGIDLSKDMVAKANFKLNSTCKNHRVEFIHGDILQEPIDSSDIIIINYTLQFLPPEKRDHLLAKVYSSLNWNGLLILSEKVSYEDSWFQQNFTDTYYGFKKDQGYSELEIARKREALENVLITDTEKAHMDRLRRSGFNHIQLAMKWCNFVSYIGVKRLVQ